MIIESAGIESRGTPSTRKVLVGERLPGERLPGERRPGEPSRIDCLSLRNAQYSQPGCVCDEAPRLVGATASGACRGQDAIRAQPSIAAATTTWARTGRARASLSSACQPSCRHRPTRASTARLATAKRSTPSPPAPKRPPSPVNPLAPAGSRALLQRSVWEGGTGSDRYRRPLVLSEAASLTSSDLYGGVALAAICMGGPSSYLY